jgi:hypothetical protein
MPTITVMVLAAFAFVMWTFFFVIVMTHARFGQCEAKNSRAPVK